MTKKYLLSGKATALCQAKTAVKGMVEAGNSSFRSFLSEKRVAGGYKLCIDELSEDWKNVYAHILKVTDEAGNEVDDEKVKYLVGAKYDITNVKFDGQDVTAEIIIDEAIVSEEGVHYKSVEKLSKEKIKKGIISKEEAEEIISYMVTNHVDEYLQIEVVNGWKQYCKPHHRPSCLYVDPYLQDRRKLHEEGIVSEGLRHGVMRMAAILEGDKSVGKNVFAETMAWVLHMPLYLITFSRQMSPGSIYGEKSTDNSAAEKLKGFDLDTLKKAEDLKAKRDFMIQHFAKMRLPGTGEEQVNAVTSMMNQILTPEENEILKKAEEFRMLQAQAASVNITIDQSELYDWLTIGGLMVFNEMNLAEANFFASFTNQLLDGTGFLFIPGRGEVKINPDCMLFGTQNADYEGVEQQNEATMSRFNAICFKQPETIRGQLEAAVNAALRKHGKNETVDVNIYEQTEMFYKQCVASVKKDVVSNACLNIRGFVRAITMVAESHGITRLRRAIEMAVINTCPVDERSELYTVLKTIVSL